MKLNGKNLRIFAGQSSNSKCIALATDCTVNVTVNTEESTTKDTDGLWGEDEIISKGWDISVNQLYDPDVTETNAMTANELVEKIITEDEPILYVSFDVTEGDKNRTATKKMAFGGNAIYTSLGINASASGKATFAHSFKGKGALNKINA